MCWGISQKEEQATMDDAVKEAADAVCEIVNVKGSRRR